MKNYDIPKFSAFNDEFGPVSKPLENHYRLPFDIKIEWVKEKDSISKLEALLEERFIGVDSEMRPEMSQFHKTNPALL